MADESSQQQQHPSKRQNQTIGFFGSTCHADHYRPFPEGVKAMDKIFRPFQRPFEPCRLPFQSKSMYDQTFNTKNPIEMERSYIGDWARRDGDQTMGSSEPMQTMSNYDASYQNPSVHVSPYERQQAYELQEEAKKQFGRPATAPHYCSSNNPNVTCFPPREPDASPSHQHERQPMFDHNQNYFHEEHQQQQQQPQTRPQTVNWPRATAFAPAFPVQFSGDSRFVSEYAARYRDYSRTAVKMLFNCFSFL